MFPSKSQLVTVAWAVVAIGIINRIPQARAVVNNEGGGFLSGIFG